MKDSTKSLITLGINSQNENGDTSLMLSVYESDLEAVKQLLVQGADVQIENNGGETVLFGAANQDDMKILRTIIDTGVDLNHQEKYYKQTALFTPAEVGHTAALRLLLKSGAEPNIKDKGGFTPLQWATQEKQLSAMKILISFGADVNNISKKGITPLMSASIAGFYKGVELLLSAGADVKMQDKKGNTAITFSEENKYPKIVKVLQEVANKRLSDENN